MSIDSKVRMRGLSLHSVPLLRSLAKKCKHFFALLTSQPSTLASAKAAAVEAPASDTKATNFELLHNIAEWLFENSEQDTFKLPHVTIKQRSQQMSEATYNF
jgi:hypothetical protein